MTRLNGWLGKKKRDEWLAGEEEEMLYFGGFVITDVEIYSAKEEALGLDLGFNKRVKWAKFYIKELGHYGLI